MLSHTQFQRTASCRNGFMSCSSFLPNSMPQPRDHLWTPVLRLESHLLSNTNPDLHTLHIHLCCMYLVLTFVCSVTYSILHPPLRVLSDQTALTGMDVPKLKLSLSVPKAKSASDSCYHCAGSPTPVSLIRSVLQLSKPHTTILTLKRQAWKSANIKRTLQFLTFLIPFSRNTLIKLYRKKNSLKNYNVNYTTLDMAI